MCGVHGCCAIYDLLTTWDLLVNFHMSHFSQHDMRILPHRVVGRIKYVNM